MMQHAKWFLFILMIFASVFFVTCSGDDTTTVETPETYIITFNPNGGSIVTRRQTVEGNKETSLATAVALGLSHETKEFAGWALKPSATKATYADGSKIIISENITLYALWNTAENKEDNQQESQKDNQQDSQKDSFQEIPVQPTPTVTISLESTTITPNDAVTISIVAQNFTETPRYICVHLIKNDTGEDINGNTYYFTNSLGLGTIRAVGMYTLYVQCAGVESNHITITVQDEPIIQTPAITISTQTGMATVGNTLEIAVACENFEETPQSVDVFVNNKKVDTKTISDGKIEISLTDYEPGEYTFYVQNGDVTSNVLDIMVFSRAIFLSASNVTALIDSTIDLTVAFENYAVAPTTVDVYRDETAIATGVAVVDGKISVSTAGCAAGEYNFYVKAGEESSNQVAVTILSQTITLSASNTTALIDSTIEFTVAFENYAETPTTVDVYRDETAIATGVAVADGKISVSTVDYTAGEYNFYVKAGEESSNQVAVTILPRTITLSADNTSTIIDSAVAFTVAFENYVQTPTTVDVYRDETAIATGVAVADGKISVSTAGCAAGWHDFYVQSGSIKSEYKKILVQQKYITNISNSYASGYKWPVAAGDSFILGIAFCYYAKLPATVDVYNGSTLFAENVPVSVINADNPSYITATISFPTKDKTLGSYSYFVVKDGEIKTEEYPAIYLVAKPDENGAYTVTTKEFSGLCRALANRESPENISIKVTGVLVEGGHLVVDLNLNSLLYLNNSPILIDLDISEVQRTASEKLTKIDSDYGFNRCENLKSVILPESVTVIGERGFASCTHFEGIDLSKNNITSIGDFAFERCHSLKTVTIPETITQVGADAFISCNNLTTVTVNSKTIRGRAFGYCPNLSEVAIEEEVSTIGAYAFFSCPALHTVSLSHKTWRLQDENGNKFKNADSITFSDDYRSYTINGSDEQFSFGDDVNAAIYLFANEFNYIWYKVGN